MKRSSGISREPPSTCAISCAPETQHEMMTTAIEGNPLTFEQVRVVEDGRYVLK
jgi:hypothetical protein